MMFGIVVNDNCLFMYTLSRIMYKLQAGWSVLDNSDIQVVKITEKDLSISALAHP